MIEDIKTPLALWSGIAGGVFLPGKRERLGKASGRPL